MTPEQFTLVLGSVTAAIVAIGGLYVQLRSLTKRVDGRLEQLLVLTAASSQLKGELAGRDHVTHTVSIPTVEVSPPV